jgi:putative DNA primase/helicase
MMVNAYALSGDKYLEQFWIWTGRGRNGKSKQADLLGKTFGEYAYNPNITMFTTKKNDASKADPQLAKARGKRIMISSEPDAKDKLISSQLKEWTGNDKIQARGLYAGNIEFYLQSSINLLCNAIPKFTTLEEAEVARINIIDFPHKFVMDPRLPHERPIDMSLTEKFRDVRYGQQYMRILIELYSKGVHGRQAIPVPGKVNAFTQQYCNEQDMVGQFIEACIDCTDNTKDKVKKKEMYNQFIDHMKDEGMGEDHMAATAFHKQMATKGFETKKISDWYYTTVKFKTKPSSIEADAGSDDELECNS